MTRKPLRIRPTLQPDETATSFMSRLALINGCERLSHFAADMGLSVSRIADGETEAVDLLACIGGVDPARLRFNAVIKTEDSYALRGQAFRRPDLLRTGLRLCPHCIRDDLSKTLDPAALPEFMNAYGRVEWQIAAYRACADHGVEIVEVGARHAFDFRYDFSQQGIIAKEEILARGADAQSVGGYELQRYIRRRLGGDLEGSWFDDWALPVVCDAAERLGLLQRAGARGLWSDASPVERIRCGDEGMALLRSGHEAINALLTCTAKAEWAPRRGLVKAKALYGNFYRWLELAKHPTYQPLRTIVRDHILDLLPINPGDEVLGERVEPRLTSIRTESLRHSMHPKRLRKLLCAGGLLSAETAALSDYQTTFPIGDAEEFIEKSKTALSQTDLQTYIGADRVQTRLLVQHGLIKPFVQFASKGPRPPQYAIARADADTFLERLSQDAVEVQSIPHGAATLPEAARQSNRSVLELIRLVLDRELAWVGKLSDVAGYFSTLVMVAEIKALLHKGKLDGMTREMIATRLGVGDRVVNKLIDCSLMKTVTVRHPVHQCLTAVVPTVEVEGFCATYVPLFSLAEDRGEHVRATVRWLASAGVAPALTREQAGATFYLRSQLPN